MADYTPWWKSQADFREKKAVIKLYDDNDQFLTSCNIPSVYWPLNGSYEVFTCENTCCFEDEEKLVTLFDTLQYRIGHCYQNTEQAANLFRRAGCRIKTYVGWLFLHGQTPIHHCWAVIYNDSGQQALLDLSCDDTKMRMWFKRKETEDPNWLNSGNAKEHLVEWTAFAKKNLTNTQRCFPCGVVPPTHLYIGSECDPEQGRQIFQNLTSKYPYHLSNRKVNAAGYNRTQWMLKQNGLME